MHACEYACMSLELAREVKIDVYGRQLTSNRTLRSTVSCSKLGQFVH